FNITNGIRETEETMTLADLYENGGAYLLGQNNAPMLPIIRYPRVLLFRAVENSQDIEIVGGTAKHLIFGEDLKNYKGTSDVVARVYGTKRIVDGGGSTTAIFSLPYRLGNCASDPKTLIIMIGGVEYTVTFDKNYMTT